MRRLFLSIMLLAAVCGCADSGASTEGAAGANGGSSKYRIAVIPKGTTHDFWLSVRAGAEQAAAELGNVEILWDGPDSESHKDLQINLVDGFINDQVDGICLAPIDRDGMIPVVRRAKNMGIPVLIFDSGLSDTEATISYVATDNYQGGVIAGEHMAKLLGGKGNVILLRYQEGSESTEQREEGFLDTLAKYPDIVIISDEQRVTTDAVEAVRVSSSLLLTHGDNVDGIFTVCESLNKGMLKALQDKQLAGEVKFIGFDSDPQLVDAMKNGEMQGIVLQDPVKMGYESVKNMVAHLKGEQVPEVISTGEALATPENMNEPRMHELLFPVPGVVRRRRMFVGDSVSSTRIPMKDVKVWLIGGAPGVGKTTLGRHLAERVGATSLSIDDLMTAARAVTTPESHPGLHVMQRRHYVDYFTNNTVDELIADATAQHEATWPAVEKVIRNHASWGSPIVIDGWAMRPGGIADLNLPNVASFWLVAPPSVFEERERRNVDFVRESPAPERMLRNFLARSLWYNELIREQVAELQLNLLEQPGTTTVDELCGRVLHRAE